MAIILNHTIVPVRETAAAVSTASSGARSQPTAGAGPDQVRTGHQLEDCRGARPPCTTVAARPRRRGDRVKPGRRDSNETFLPKGDFCVWRGGQSRHRPYRAPQPRKPLLFTFLTRNEPGSSSV